MPFHQFPYANLQDLNIDWILNIIKEFYDKFSNLDETFQNMLDQVNEAGTNAIEAITNNKDTALASIQVFLEQCVQVLTAATDASVTSVRNEGTTQVGNIQSEGTTQFNSVHNEGLSKIADINTTGAAQIQAIENKEAYAINNIQALINTIPQTYEDALNQLQIINSILNQVYTYPAMVQGVYSADPDHTTTLVYTDKVVSTFLTAGCADRTLSVSIVSGTAIIKDILWWTGWGDAATSHVIPVSTSGQPQTKIRVTFPQNATYFSVNFCYDLSLETALLTSDFVAKLDWRSNLIDKVMKFKAISDSIVPSEYNSLAATLEGNTYSWINCNVFNDIPFTDYGWIYTMSPTSVTSESAYCGQFIVIPRTGYIYARYRRSGTWTDWTNGNKNDLDSFIDEYYFVNNIYCSLENDGQYTITPGDLVSGLWNVTQAQDSDTRARTMYLIPVRAGMVVTYNNNTFDCFFGVASTRTSVGYDQVIGWRTDTAGSINITTNGWLTFVIRNHSDVTATVDPSSFDGTVNIFTSMKNDIIGLKSANANENFHYNYVSQGSASSDYNYLSSNLEGNTFSFIDGSWFSDIPFTGTLLIFTYSSKSGTETATYNTQRILNMTDGSEYVRFRSGTYPNFTWSNWNYANASQFNRLDESDFVDNIYESFANDGQYTIKASDLVSGVYSYSDPVPDNNRGRIKYLIPARKGMTITYTSNDYDVYFGVLSTKTSGTYAQAIGWKTDAGGSVSLTTDGFLVFNIRNHANISTPVNVENYNSVVTINTAIRGLVQSGT